jgi:hypothetical protein
MNYHGRKGRLWDLCGGILAPELGDDVEAVLLRADAFSFEHFQKLPQCSCCRVWGVGLAPVLFSHATH